MYLDDFTRRQILQCASISDSDSDIDSLTAATVDGGSNFKSKSMYSEAELRRAERRMVRERERRKKIVVLSKFFQRAQE